MEKFCVTMDASMVKEDIARDLTLFSAEEIHAERLALLSTLPSDVVPIPLNENETGESTEMAVNLMRLLKGQTLAELPRLLRTRAYYSEPQLRHLKGRLLQIGNAIDQAFDLAVHSELRETRLYLVPRRWQHRWETLLSGFLHPVCVMTAPICLFEIDKG